VKDRLTGTYSDCVLDVALLETREGSGTSTEAGEGEMSKECIVIELNPFERETGAALFDWSEPVLQHGPLELRLTEVVGALAEEEVAEEEVAEEEVAEEAVADEVVSEEVVADVGLMEVGLVDGCLKHCLPVGDGGKESGKDCRGKQCTHDEDTQCAHDEDTNGGGTYAVGARTPQLQTAADRKAKAWWDAVCEPLLEGVEDVPSFSEVVGGGLSQHVVTQRLLTPPKTAPAARGCCIA
jgi:hypothetical protein